MIDVHYHLLYGVDDGPKVVEDSLALAELSIAEGVTHIVATPHANYRYPFDAAINRARMAQINEKLNGRLALGLGCDFHLSHENVSDAIEHVTKYTINGSKYLLVELPDLNVSSTMLDNLSHFQYSGIVPIVTHPERSPMLMSKPVLMKKLLGNGCLVQITASSLFGRFGKRAQQACHHMLKRNWVHLVASDAHNLKNRPPMMKRAYIELKKKYGVETANRLCDLNPRAIFDGRPLAEQPELLDMEDSMPFRSRGILGKIFSR